MKKENTVAEGIVLLHNPKMWNGEFKSPIDWHVPLQNRNGIWLKQRAFFLRTGGGKDTEHGIFAAGIVIAPPPDANTDGLPPPLFWYPDPANPGKESPHVNVQVDIPSTFLAGGCEESNPVLVPSDVLGTEAPFRNFFRPVKGSSKNRVIRQNGAKIKEPGIVEPLRQRCREACQNLRR